MGNLIGKTISPCIFIDSLQCINVSSKSNTIVLLVVVGNNVFFSSIIAYDVYLIVLANCYAYIVYIKCSLIYSIYFVISIAI